MDKQKAKKRIDELNKLTAYYAKKYYDEDAPEISDFEYDMLMNELKNLEKEFPEFISKDSLTQKVGGTVIGFDKIAFNRYKKSYDELTNYQKKNITNGPGKLCMALEIDRSFNSQYILDSDLYISDFYIDENGEKVFDDNDFEVVESKRINIDYAEEAKDYLWRYYIKGNKYVSVK